MELYLDISDLGLDSPGKSTQNPLEAQELFFEREVAQTIVALLNREKTANSTSRRTAVEAIIVAGFIGDENVSGRAVE